jgi:hypothetical protein
MDRNRRHRLRAAAEAAHATPTPATIDDFDVSHRRGRARDPGAVRHARGAGAERRLVWRSPIWSQSREHAPRRWIAARSAAARCALRGGVGYKYFLGAHKGLVHGPVDSLNRIRVADKVAGSGKSPKAALSRSTNPRYSAARIPGARAASGHVHVPNGDPLQLPSTYLQEQLGEPIPAFRGVSCGIVEQMYVSAFNPYLKPWAFLMTRTDITWYVGKAELSLCIAYPPKSDKRST